MSKAIEKEQRTRIADLEAALRTIGRGLADTALPPARRIERANGILAMYEALPPSYEKAGQEKA